jgi:hypothetical protein
MDGMSIFTVPWTGLLPMSVPTKNWIGLKSLSGYRGATLGKIL